MADFVEVNGLKIKRYHGRLEHTNNSATPDRMIMMDGILNSTMVAQVPIKNPDLKGGDDIDLSKCAELYGSSFKMSRLTKGNTASEMFSSSKVQQSPVGVIIPTCLYVAQLTKQLTDGINIDQIHLIRLFNADKKQKPLRITTFRASKIDYIEEDEDETIITFRPASVQVTYYKNKQDGTPEGQDTTFFDFRTGMTEPSE